jgi:hypothetical protein
MTLQVELSPETEQRLAAQAAARSMDLRAYAVALLEEAANPVPRESRSQVDEADKNPDLHRKSLPQLFAESPFRGLDMDFERDPDTGRDIAL